MQRYASVKLFKIEMIFAESFLFARLWNFTPQFDDVFTFHLAIGTNIEVKHSIDATMVLEFEQETFKCFPLRLHQILYIKQNENVVWQLNVTLTITHFVTENKLHLFE